MALQADSPQLPVKWHPKETGLSTRISVVVSLTLILLNASFAQELAPAPPEAETFRSTTRLVVLDVVVTNHSGQPIGNLSPGGFTVLEDGVPQQIASFESPELRPGVPLVAERGKGNVEAKTISAGNPASPSALSILVLDELNSEVLDQAYARFAIQKFLQKHGPRLGQPASLMILGEKRLELLHDYTQDANALVEALSHRHAELPFGLMTAEFSGAGERLSKTLWALQQIAAANNHFAGRKNVIWIGPGFPAINSVLVLDEADRHRFAAAVSEDANLLLEARVTVYTINPRGLEVSPVMYGAAKGGGFMTGTHDQASGELVFESIAPDTGGKIFRLRNDVDVAIATSVDDGAAYYTLAYYPTNHEWNGKFRSVQVTAHGQDLQTRARKGYFAVADVPLSDNQIDTVLSRAVMNPLPFRALDVHATARRAGPQAGRFTLKVDRHALYWQTLPTGKRRCEVTVVIASVGTGDRVYSHKVTEIESVVDGKHFEGQWDKPVAFNVVSDMPPNTRHVRIVVRDVQNGHIGSADLLRESLPVR